MSEIKLSEKHGLNPSISICFFCRGDKDIILNGRLPGDAEAPKKVLVDYEPCDKCKEQMKLGVTIIEATQEPTDAPPIQEGVWPTGRWCVIRTEAAKDVFGEDVRDTILLDKSIFEEMLG